MKNLKSSLLAIAMGAASLSLIEASAFACGFGDRAGIDLSAQCESFYDMTFGGGSYGKSTLSQERYAPANLLKRIDENGDGVVTLDEYSTSFTNRATRRLDLLDQNQDGTISAEEYDASLANRRGTGDFELDPAALQDCMVQKLGNEFSTRPSWDDLVGEADTNQDGQIDEAEFMSLQQTDASDRFSAIDINGDGALDETELETVRNQIQERLKARRTCMQEQRETNGVFGF